MSSDILKLDQIFRKILKHTLEKIEDIKCTELSTPWYRYLCDMTERRKTVMSDERVFDYDFYVLETGIIISKYIDELNTPLKKVFGRREPEQRKQKATIVKEYIQIISKLYISSVYPRRFDGIQEQKLSDKEECYECGGGNLLYEKDTELFTCAECGVQQLFSNVKGSFYDSKRTNTTQRSSNEKRNHFINCFNQYEGSQCIDLPIGFLGEVRDILNKYSLVDSGLEEKYSRVTKEHIKLILKDMKLYRKYCDSLTYIYREITEQPCRDLSLLKEKVLNDFDMFDEVYNKKYSLIKKPFHYQQLLFQFLRRHGHACHRNDFKFLKTTDRKMFHEKVYKEIFADLGWNYTPT